MKDAMAMFHLTVEETAIENAIEDAQEKQKDVMKDVENKFPLIADVEEDAAVVVYATAIVEIHALHQHLMAEISETVFTNSLNSIINKNVVR